MYCGFLWGTQPSNIAKSVLRPSANSGSVKIASAMSVANERLLDRVRHFVEPRWPEAEWWLWMKRSSKAAVRVGPIETDVFPSGLVF